MNENDFFKKITYTVQKGDTLYSIAQKYQTSVDQIMYLNHLSTSLLIVGQELTIRLPLKEENLTSNYQSYEHFIEEHKGNGFLRVKTTLAQGMIPLNKIKIVVSKEINQKKFIFFEGETNESGLVNPIALPTLVRSKEDPTSTDYLVEAVSEKYRSLGTYYAKMYDQVTTFLEMDMIPREAPYE